MYCNWTAFKVYFNWTAFGNQHWVFIWMCIPLHKRHLENTLLPINCCIKYVLLSSHIVFYFIQMVANGIWQYSVQSRDWLLARAKTIGYIKPTLHDCMTVLFLTTLIVIGVGLHAAWRPMGCGDEVGNPKAPQSKDL